MSITPVQTAGDFVDFANYAPGLFSHNVSFTTDCTASNTIVVVVSGIFFAPAAWTADNATCTDTQGNTYTLLQWVDGVGTSSGGYGGLFVATAIAGGPTTVTVSFTLHQDLFFQPGIDFLVIIAEYPTPGGPTSVVSSNLLQIYGAAGSSPQTLNLTDSLGATIGVTFGGSIGGGGVGAIAVLMAADLNVGGTDFLIAVLRTILGPSTTALPLTVPSGYATFVLEKDQTRTDSGDWLYLWDAGHAGVLSITCGSPADGTVGTPYTHNFSATTTGGTPPYTWAITVGSLPPGLSLNGSTGVVSGTPTTGGTYPFTIQVTDSLAATASVSCSIKIVSTLSISCDDPPSGTVGVSYSHGLIVTGGTPPYDFSIISGSLPPGLTIDALTGIISGTPTTPGSYTFSVKVTDMDSNSVTCSLLILGISGVGANIYVLRDHKLTDDDFGQIYPYYVTYFSPTAEQKQQMALGGTQNLLAYLSAFIEANSYLHIGCNLTLTFYVNMLQNPWALTVQRGLPPNATFSMECAAGSVQGERIAVKFESSPLEGQTDNAFNLQRVIFYYKQGRLPVRGSAS